MKHRKIYQCGKTVHAFIYSSGVAAPRDRFRRERTQATSKIRQKINHRVAAHRLEMLIESNFTRKDFRLELTFSDECLPDYAKAKVIIKNFLNKLRRLRSGNLKYIYVVENLHARLHFHLIVNGTGKSDLADIRRLWLFGEMVEVEYLDGSGNYKGLAEYLTKESRDNKAPNARRWVSSLSLVKPKVEITPIGDNEDIVVPVGAVLIEREDVENEFGQYKYIKYVLNSKPKRKPFIRSPKKE